MVCLELHLTVKHSEGISSCTITSWCMIYLPLFVPNESGAIISPWCHDFNTILIMYSKLNAKSLWNCFCNKIHRLIIFKEFHELMFNSWTFLIPKNTSENSAMFFLTNRSVIFCVIHVRHCELFGSLLSLAISDPRLCCSETLLQCKSPQLYSELSHLYFLRCIFKKIFWPHLYWSLYRDLFIT